VRVEVFFNSIGIACCRLSVLRRFFLVVVCLFGRAAGERDKGEGGWTWLTRSMWEAWLMTVRRMW
jgi:hypothetical protein